MFFERSRALVILFAAMLLAACGGGGGGSARVTDNAQLGNESSAPPPSGGAPLRISGSVGDGPIVGADVIVMDAFGKIIARTSTGSSASYELEVPSNAALPVVIEATGGTDLVTGRPAEFPLRAIAFETGVITRNVTPYTTLALAMASCDGAVQSEELASAWLTLGETLDFGLPAERLDDPMTTPIDDDNVAPVLLSNEALGEVLRRSKAALGASGDDATQAEILNDLACDLADGIFDGSGAGADRGRSVITFLAALAVRLEVLEGALHVDGASAMDALDDALRTIRPSSPTSVSAVVPSAAMIDQTLRALAALQGVVSDPSLTTLRFTLAEASPTTVRALVAENFDSVDRVRVSALAESIALNEEAALNSLAVRLGSQGSSAEPMLAFAANTLEVDAGANAQLSWSSEAADECFASGDWSGQQPLEGVFQTAALDRPTSFTLTCAGLGGLTKRTVSVTVLEIEPWSSPTLELDVSSRFVRTGSTATVSWAAADAVICRAEGDWSGTRPLSGSLSIGPLNSASTLAMTCAGPGGSVSKAVTVNVTAPPPEPPPQTAESPPDPGGESEAPVEPGVGSSETSLTLAASATTVADGEGVTLTWSSQDASACEASGGWSGARAPSGTEDVGPLNEATTFSLSCSGSGGNAVEMLLVRVESAVSLRWQAPSQNIDGSPLDDLAGYRVYVGSSSGSYELERIEINDANSTSLELMLASGTYYVAMRALDADGNESGLSNEVVKNAP